MEPYAVGLVRLTDVPLDDVLGLLNEPHLRRHMPLSADVTRDEARAWVVAKDAQWAEHGYGPWAVILDQTFAGWGGFQAEPAGADLALVLLPPSWGAGLAVVYVLLDRGFGELGLPEVLVTLPPTRRPDRALARLGFADDGEVTLEGETFRRFRLRAEVWAARSRDVDAVRGWCGPAFSAPAPVRERTSSSS